MTKTSHFTGGPRQVSLQLKASEPSLRRSLRPATKAAQFEAGSTITAPAPATEDEVERESQRAPEPQFDFAPAAEPVFESVGPVIEQNAVIEPEPVVTAPESTEPIAPPAPAQWDEPIPAIVQDFAPPTPQPIALEPEPIAPEPIIPEAFAPTPEPVAPEPEPEPYVAPLEPEFEPIAQGQPVPYQVPVSEIEPPVTTEMTNAEVADTVAPVSADLAAEEVVAAPEAFTPPVETPVFEPQISEPLIVQPTYQVTMPEPVQTPAPVRTPTSGGAQPASSMHTAVQLTFSFEIASMQLTPTFKMGALQLRPSSKIVTMRLAPSQQPQPAMNLQVTFEIARIQPTGGGLGTVRLTPSQQQRPQVTGSPSFTVAGLQLVSNFEAAPVQLTPSQSAAVLVTSSFQIATVEFSPSFEIASIVLNATSKNVAVQLPGSPAADGAPSFEISNLQLGATGDIGMMQINMLGQGPRR